MRISPTNIVLLHNEWDVLFEELCVFLVELLVDGLLAVGNWFDVSLEAGFELFGGALLPDGLEKEGDGLHLVFVGVADELELL